MKIKGREIKGPNVEFIYIPRGDGQDDIVFKAQAIMDMEPFTKACPAPLPPSVKMKDGQIRHLVDDPDYLKRLEGYGELRTAWMVIQTIKATDGIEWNLVKYEDPNTWPLYKQELLESGFSDIEIGRIINGVMTANCLNETRLNEARSRFLLSQAVEAAGL